MTSAFRRIGSDRVSQVGRYRVTHHSLLIHGSLVTDLMKISRNISHLLVRRPGRAVRLRLFDADSEVTSRGGLFERVHQRTFGDGDVLHAIARSSELGRQYRSPASTHA